MPAWFAVGSGAWNANGSANPATGVGGISLAFCGGNNLFAFGLVNAGATGDIVTANFGGSTFAFPSLPSGFSAYGSSVTFDPATVQNGTLSGGNLILTEASIGIGGALATVGIAPGTKKYFELTITHAASISAHATGVAIGRSGAGYAQMATGSGGGGGQFSGSDPNGGAALGFTGTSGHNGVVDAAGSLAVDMGAPILSTSIIRVAFEPEGSVGPSNNQSFAQIF